MVICLHDLQVVEAWRRRCEHAVMGAIGIATAVVGVVCEVLLSQIGWDHNSVHWWDGAVRRIGWRCGKWE